MRLPNIITAVMIIVAIFLVTFLVKDAKVRQQQVMPVALAKNIVITEEKPAPQPTVAVSPPKPEMPSKPMVTQTVPLVISDSALLGQKNNDELAPVKQEKADGKWYLAVDSAPRLIRVDLDRQRVLFYQDGKLVHEFKCSSSVTGKVSPADQHPDTPHDHIGVFSVQNKILKKWSREWKVWMPNALLYHNGHYIHATLEVGNLGHRASHGCIRLSPKDAKTLYAQVQIGDPVEIE